MCLHAHQIPLGASKHQQGKGAFERNTEPAMYKIVAFTLLVACLVETTLCGRQNWRHLARCLQLSSARTSPKHILQFIRRHGYMIIPQSNPPTEEQGAMRPSKRAIYSGKCPFKMEVKDFVDTVPRFLSSASCIGCDVRCKPIPYTLKLLRRKCENYWVWEDYEVQVAYVLEV